MRSLYIAPAQQQLCVTFEDGTVALLRRGCMGAGLSTSGKPTATPGKKYGIPEGDWFHALVGGERIGPVTAVRLHELHTAGSVPNNAIVWCPRLTQWTPYRDALLVLMREVALASTSAPETAAPAEEVLPHVDVDACARSDCLAKTSVCAAGLVHPVAPTTVPTGWSVGTIQDQEAPSVPGTHTPSPSSAPAPLWAKNRAKIYSNSLR